MNPSINPYFQGQQNPSLNPFQNGYAFTPKFRAINNHQNAPQEPTQTQTAENHNSTEKNNAFSEQGLSRINVTTTEFARIENTLSLNLTTAEGDKATIYIGSSYQQNQFMNINSENGQTEISAASTEASKNVLQYQIQGELNEEELASIDNFLTQIAGIANDFFQGSTQEAFLAAQNLNYDEEQIASFAFDLQQVQTVATSSQVSAYQQEPGPGVNIAEMVNKVAQTTQQKIPSLFDEVNPFTIFESLVKEDERYQENQKNMLNLLNQSGELLKSYGKTTEIL